MREAFYEVGIFTTIELSVELVIFFDAALEWPMPKVRILGFAVFTDGNIRVEIL